jgi:hypothetical protein
MKSTNQIALENLDQNSESLQKTETLKQEISGIIIHESSESQMKPYG